MKISVSLRRDQTTKHFANGDGFKIIFPIYVTLSWNLISKNYSYTRKKEDIIIDGRVNHIAYVVMDLITSALTRLYAYLSGKKSNGLIFRLICAEI